MLAPRPIMSGEFKTLQPTDPVWSLDYKHYLVIFFCSLDECGDVAEHNYMCENLAVRADLVNQRPGASLAD